MRAIVIAVFTVMLVGCVAAGTQVKQEQLAQFHKGESTYQDVISVLGRPNSSTISGEGDRIACYTFIQSTIRGESLIPIVGMFAGGADSHVDMTCLTFNREGILARYTSTTSETGAGHGFESGNSPSGDRVASEPKHTK
jgi:hypothetical protein